MIKIIANVSKNNVIGKDGNLASHYKEDMKFFKNQTIGQTVIMGKNTFISLGSKPLPNRTNVVISQTLTSDENVIIVKSLKDAVEFYKNAWLIGGRQIYEEGMNYTSEMYITRSPDIITGDNLVYFPEIDSRFELEFSTVFELDLRLELCKYRKKI